LTQISENKTMVSEAQEVQSCQWASF